MSTPPYTPEVHVEFAFGYGPLADTTDGSFVEPAAVYPTQVIVDGVQIGRGRPSEFDTFQPGTCQISIVDRNRVFDPQNTAGPYYGLLKPRVPVRVRGKIGSTYYPRFYGYVDGWPMQIARQETLVNIVATDGFKILSGIGLPQSLYEAEVVTDSPRAYWKLGEETGSVAADSSGNRHDGVYTNALQNQATVVPYGGDGSMGLTVRSTQGVVITDEGCKVGSTTSGSFTVEMWVKANSTANARNSRLDLYRQGSGGTYGVGFVMQVYTETYITSSFLGLVPAGAPTLNLVTKSPALTKHWSAPTILDGNPHHVVVVCTVAASAITVLDAYIDGAALIPVRSDTGVVTDTIPESFIGAGPVVTDDLSFDGFVDEVAVYPVAMSTANITAHYTAGFSLGDGEVTGARVTRVLDLIGWPASKRSIDNGEMILGPAVIDGRKALDYLQAVANSEQGRLFMSTDGKVTFHSRDRFITQSTESTSQFTFSDDGAGDSIYGGAQFVYDERLLYNQAVVTRDGGSPVTIDSTSSQASYGPHTRTLSGLLLRDDGQSRSVAEYIVYRYSQPQVRAEEWVLQPEVDATSFAAVLGLDIGYRVTVENKPANKGAQFALALHIEQITETITPRTWAVSYRGSPADPNSAIYFTFGGTSAQSFGNGVWR